MYPKTKFLLKALVINFIFFLYLFIGIQNSSKKSSVNFLNFKTVEIPIGFLVGASSVIGSSIGSVLITICKEKKETQIDSNKSS